MKKKIDEEIIEHRSREQNSSEEFERIYNIRTPKI
jgi:hypothetical protein